MNQPEPPDDNAAHRAAENGAATATADGELATGTDVRSEERKVSRIDRVVERVRERLGEADPEGVELFVRRLYGSVTTEDVLDRREADLAGAALSLWRLAAERAPREVKVRVFNPDAERDGWTTPHTVVELVNDDMPFLVSSVTTELIDHGVDLHLVLHPVVGLTRDGDGRRTGVCEVDDEAPRESLMHIEIDQETTAERLDELTEALTSVLGDVRRVVDDWRPMVQRVEEILDEIDDRPPPVEAESAAAASEFLSWLVEDHFTFLGYREYDLVEKGDDVYLRLVPDSGLGLLANVREDSAERSRKPQPPAIASFLRQRELLIVTKTHARSPVHRPVAMDYIAVRRFDDSGHPVAERRFLGLFSSAVYHRSVGTIPLLTQKVQRVVDRVGFQPRSHDARTLRHLLETFPRDELFQISDDELYEISLGILRLQERQRVALFVRKDPFERFVSALVYVPRDRHSTELRRRIEAMLAEACDGVTTSFSTQVGDQPLARAHYIFQTQPGEVPAIDVKALERKIADEARTWGDRLRRALVEAHGEEQGLAVLRRYEDAFPGSYRESQSADDAVLDVERIDHVAAGGDLATRLYRPTGAASHEVRFKVFHPEPVRDLSDLLPMLEDMGLRVVWEVPYEVRPALGGEDEGTVSVWIRDFLLATDDRMEIDLTASQEHFRDAFERVWGGELESDLYNRLVVAAGLDWREVTLLRAYGRYLQQVGIAFSQDYMAATLARHPQTSRSMVELFRRMFDPEQAGQPSDVDGLKQDIRRSLATVTNLDEDRILRRFLNLVRSTRRTNYFQLAEEGGPKPYLSFKFDGRKVSDLPEPRPRHEVWVYSPRMEGVHLRGGRVARGGIRWSDRQQDFRTEIRGLVKAQMVKNAVIVPVGAKGGFVVKNPPPPEAGRGAFLEEGIACYRLFISGLLDITDNLAGGDVV
ncbi:MAG TPA: NAD-glutamate dehydrogenase domain-containing protein, partial [Thermoanaerobaculia bacterium]|nr:NAD-glutamate dehydrogenase domain-containing protein [Thermoanaerobaculia bacterium]